MITRESSPLYGFFFSADLLILVFSIPIDL